VVALRDEHIGGLQEALRIFTRPGIGSSTTPEATAAAAAAAAALATDAPAAAAVAAALNRHAARAADQQQQISGADSATHTAAAAAAPAGPVAGGADGQDLLAAADTAADRIGEVCSTDQSDGSEAAAAAAAAAGGEVRDSPQALDTAPAAASAAAAAAAAAFSAAAAAAVGDPAPLPPPEEDLVKGALAEDFTPLTQDRGYTAEVTVITRVIVSGLLAAHGFASSTGAEDVPPLHLAVSLLLSLAMSAESLCGVVHEGQQQQQCTNTVLLRGQLVLLLPVRNALACSSVRAYVICHRKCCQNVEVCQVLAE